MKITAMNIFSSLISLMLVRWVLDHFGWNLGILVCGIIVLMLCLVAGGVEKIAKVMRAAAAQLKDGNQSMK